jgi:RNA polymerase sigma-70 factor (ECF subfamily)
MNMDNAPAAETPDVALMILVSAGDSDAFGLLYRRHYRKLLDFFYAMSGNTQMAEDLCQETFLRVWRLRNRYTPTGSYLGYLFAIARYVWLERRAEAYRRSAFQPLSSGGDGPEPIDPAALPDELACRSELSGTISEAVSSLPEDQRMAFVLRTVQGLSLEEIASAMGCPLNTVRSRKLLAMKKLREALRGLLSA